MSEPLISHHWQPHYRNTVFNRRQNCAQLECVCIVYMYGLGRQKWQRL